MTSIRVGCSGWNYASWRHGVFYPERLPARRWLSAYAEHFGTVEVNATFYRLPRRETAARWCEETPGDFTFAVKVSRYVTHIRRLREARQHLGLLLARIEPLIEAGKLGPLLWQLPPTFARDDARLAAMLAELPGDYRHALEFRHRSWFAEPVLESLRRHGVALVIADGPGVASIQPRALTANFVYVRFHRGTRGRRGNYSATELEEWTARLRDWSRRRDVYAYFNNDWEGFAPANAARLQQLLGGKGFPAHDGTYGHVDASGDRARTPSGAR
jgi:uncharacterized protein YecE (DUF72 family)